VRRQGRIRLVRGCPVRRALVSVGSGLVSAGWLAVVSPSDWLIAAIAAGGMLGIITWGIWPHIIPEVGNHD
jgi:hypothetical protein